MGLRIKTNVESLTAQRRLAENTKQLSSSLEKLSSGQRINKSADDAAGLAVSERIRARMRSLGVAKRNANDGVSYIQMAEGGLNEVTNILVRMRELTSQSASDTVGDRERSFLDSEFQQLRQEAARIVDSTEFNGSKVLKTDGGARDIQIFVGASNRGNDINGDAPSIDSDSDPDILTIRQDELETFAEDLSRVTADELNIISNGDGAQDLGPSGTEDLFNRLDTALNAIGQYRATLGAVQSRLNSTITNIDISSENLAAAHSRIRDVDYAQETARFAQAKILTQAGLSVQAQANQVPDMALQLIRAS